MSHRMLVTMGGDQAGPHWPTDSSVSGPELATSGHTRQPLPGLFAVTTATSGHCTQGELELEICIKTIISLI